MSLTWAVVCRQVITRANDRCEYCRMHQSLQGATFHVEHILPKIAGGTDSEDNLCLACPSCNLHKSSRTESIDPESELVVVLFHPRTDRWVDHFKWYELQLQGSTAIGRATVVALLMNSIRRLRIREAEAMFELFPPDKLF